MNAKLTAAAAILVVAIVGLAAFEGSTNSWWSDQENATLEINTGYLKLDIDDYSLTIDDVPIDCDVSVSEANESTMIITLRDSTIFLEPGNVVKLSYAVEYDATISGARTVEAYVMDSVSNTELNDPHISMIYVEKIGDKDVSEDWYFFEKGTHNTVAEVTFDIGGEADLKMDHAYSFCINTGFVQSKALFTQVDSAEDLVDALTSTENGFIALSGDVTLSNGLSLGQDSDVVLDLHGHDLVFKSVSGITVNGGKLSLVDDADGSGTILTVDDGIVVVNGGYFEMAGGNLKSSTGTGIVAGYSNQDDSGANVYISGGSVTAQEHAVWAVNGSKVVITGGEFTAIDNVAVTANGTQGEGPVDVTITGGTFNCGIVTSDYLACGVFVAQDGNWKILGGTFNMTSDKATAFVVRGGNVNIDLSKVTVNMGSDMDSSSLRVGDSTRVQSGHIVAAYYTNGSYGFDGSNASLTIDDIVVIDEDNLSTYVGSTIYYYDN